MMRDEREGTHVCLSFLVSLPSCGLDRTLIEDAVGDSQFLVGIGFDIQVIGGALGDLFEDRRRGLSAVVTLLRLIQHHINAKLRSICGEETDERGKKLVM